MTAALSRPAARDFPFLDEDIMKREWRIEK
jgi:hypothetical protein